VAICRSPRCDHYR
jgi:hypothetical protein